jgi:hypothetical protein
VWGLTAKPPFGPCPNKKVSLTRRKQLAGTVSTHDGMTVLRYRQYTPDLHVFMSQMLHPQLKMELNIVLALKLKTPYSNIHNNGEMLRLNGKCYFILICPDIATVV